MAGAQDNGIMLKNDNTAFFKNYRQGDGFDIAFPHGHGSAVLATVNKNTYFYYAWDWGSIHFSINQQNGVWFKPVAYSYFDSTKFIGGLTNVVAWRSFGNSGNSYSEYSCNARWALITSPSNNNRLYSAGGPEWNDWGTNAEKVMHRSDDKGVNWTPPSQQHRISGYHRENNFDCRASLQFKHCLLYTRRLSIRSQSIFFNQRGRELVKSLVRVTKYSC